MRPTVMPRGVLKVGLSPVGVRGLYADWSLDAAHRCEAGVILGCVEGILEGANSWDLSPSSTPSGS